MFSAREESFPGPIKRTASRYSIRGSEGWESWPSSILYLGKNEKLRRLTIIQSLPREEWEGWEGWPSSILYLGKNEKAEKVDPSSFLYLGKNEKAENVDYYLFSS
jgi:hypothetical protein